MPEVYERKDEWGGYSVRKSEKGFIVEHWSARQGELTGDKYLLPYGVGLVSDYNDADPLDAMHNAEMTVGDYLYHVATNSMGSDYRPDGIRILRKGHIVQ